MQPLLATMLLVLLAAAMSSLGQLVAAGSTPSSSIINTTCLALTYHGYPGHDYCVSVLSSDPAAASARDMRELVVIAANATAHNLTSTIGLLNKLRGGLAECVVSYDRMGKMVGSALADLNAGGDPNGPANKLDQAWIEPNNCNIELILSVGAGKNVLVQENHENFVLARFASRIARRLPV